MNKMLNKKGGEKLLSVWWFFVLAIVGVGVSAGVLIYHSADVDIREIEAEILYEKILNCITEQGFLIEEALKEDFNVSDFFEECELNEEIFEEESIFYFNIQILDESENLIKEIRGGDFSFEKDCKIQEEDEEGKKIEAKYYPRCVREKETILYYEDNEIKEATLEILTASNQVGRKISLMEGQGGEFGGGGAEGKW